MSSDQPDTTAKLPARELGQADLHNEMYAAIWETATRQERERCARIARNFTHLNRTSLWVRDAIAEEIERG